MKEKMKKFDELRRLAEKHLDYDYDVETLKQYCELEPQEIEYINMTNPKTILDLLADRENLREALKKLTNESQGFLSMADMHTHGYTNMQVLDLRINEARAALNKSDEVDE